MSDDKYDEANTCYWCGKPRDCYFGMLCDECRAEAARIERDEAAKGG